jgi:serine phosphatase RsbU (regulator of sigma subunit)
MRVVVEQGEASFSDQEFQGGTIYIGRHEQCQVKLPGDDQVAPRHVMVYENHGKWFIEPLHDQFHFTSLNGKVLRERTELIRDSEVTIHTFRIKLFQKPKVKDKSLPFQIISRSHLVLQETVGFGPAEMDLPDNVIIKKRNETFSLSKGGIDYLSEMALRMMEISDVRGLLGSVIDTLMSDYDAACVWIGLRTEEDGSLHLSAGRDITGRPIDAPPACKRLQYATVECARSLLLQSLESSPEQSCMASPLISADGSLGMIYLESAKGKPRYNVADLDMLVFICNYLAMAIDRLLRLQSEQLDKFRSLDQEMSRKVQLRTAPWQLPQWPELQVGVLTEPGAAVCTDFYDVLPVGEKQAMILVGQTLAGQSDTAISIAEMSSAFRIGAVHRDLPQVLLRQINWLMFSTANEPRRLSAGVVSIDPQTGEFYICLAGNVFAYLISATGKAVQIKTEGNPLVGEARKSKYDAVQGKLNSDQMLALCTGGISNIMSPDGHPMGEQHLLDFLSDNCDQVPARILSDLAEDINSYTGAKKQPNDITLLLLRKGKTVG